MFSFPFCLQALCHIREIPSTGSHDDPLSYYQIGDFIRGLWFTSNSQRCVDFLSQPVFRHVFPEVVQGVDPQQVDF